jgi:hypothetical protein
MQDHKVNFISGFIVFAAVVGLFGYFYFTNSSKKEVSSGLKEWQMEAIAPSDQNQFIKSNGKFVQQYIEAREESNNMLVAENAEKSLEENAKKITEIIDWVGEIEAINGNSIECTCANVHLHLFFDEDNSQKISELKVGDMIKFSGKKQILGVDAESQINDVALGIDMDFDLRSLKLITVE